MMQQLLITNETQIRKLPYRVLRELAQILDDDGERGWRALVSQMPDEMYSQQQVMALERVSRRRGESPTMDLLTDMGYQLKTVGELVTYLEAIGNQEALLKLKPLDPVVILEHPSDAVVQEKHTLVLRCKASGFPVPTYQWHHNGAPLLNKCSFELRVQMVDHVHEGTYICKVTNPAGSEYSKPAKVVVAEIENHVNGDAAVYDNAVLGLPTDEEMVTAWLGSNFQLKCDPGPDPTFSFQWFKNGCIIPGATSSVLRFDPVRRGDDGFYFCRMTDSCKSSVTNGTRLKVCSEGFESSWSANQQYATGKIALVIGNKDYEHPRSAREVLVHPMNDAVSMKEILIQLGFEVICLTNLTKTEMEVAVRAYCKMLSIAKGMYSLFYFCGHGFEEHGKTYLVPVDSDTDWTIEGALSAEQILSDVQHCRSTKLDVFLLDVCRIPSGSENIPNKLKGFDPPFLPGAQCVVGYATCPQAQAFEKRRDDNGLYMKYLSRYLQENLPIEQVLHKVNVAARRETESHHATAEMAPTFKSMTNQVFSLCDPIIPTGFVEGEVDPTVAWLRFHRLPSNHSVPFDHGIVVDMEFLQLCSNVCRFVLRVSNRGSACACDAFLHSVAESVNLDEKEKNVEHPCRSHEFASKSLRFDEKSLSSMDDFSLAADIERRSTISGLQKLTGPLRLTIALRFTLRDEQEQVVYKNQIFSQDEFGVVALFASAD